MTEPTDAEIWQMWMPMVRRMGVADPVEFARAVLAKWGTPAPVGVESACQRCRGSGEDPEGYYDQSRGPDGATHDGPCRICAGSGAAQAAPVDATTWQPIATAPKDGKAILLRSKNGRIADGLWSAANSRTGFWAWAYVHQEPAEWMPKPGSPAARAQEQQP